LNSRFATTGAVTPGAGGGRGRAGDTEQPYWIVYRELRDDRVSVFADHLRSGTFSFAYLARATTAGTYVARGATTEEMYGPEVRARTAIGRFTVTEK